MSIWPNFFIVGAPRAGTTSLYEYLKKIPEIYMSSIKEPNYFATNIDPNLLLSKPVKEKSKYLELFKNVTSEKAIGEASPNYLWDENAPKLISENVPDAKIIIILRNPVERAYSHYLMHMSNGSENRPFKQVIEEALKSSTNDYVRRIIECGYYYKQILNYRKYFPENQIKIFRYEDLEKNTRQMIKDILDFLGVSASIPEDLSIRYNRYSVPRGDVSATILANNTAKNIGKKVLPNSVGTYILKKIFNKEIKKPDLPLEEKQLLEKIYADDSRNLKKILQFPINWSYL